MSHQKWAIYNLIRRTATCEGVGLYFWCEIQVYNQVLVVVSYISLYQMPQAEQN